MAEDESRADDARATTTFLPQYDAPTFWRLARWGLAACAAVALTVFVCTSDMGMRRLALAYANSQNPAAPYTTPTVAPARDVSEVVRLNETVRRLTADRDRLMARIEAIERSMTDLTGSTSLGFTPPRPATLPPPPETTPAPLAMPANPPASAAPPTAPGPMASNSPANPPTTAPPLAPITAQDPVTPETQAKIEFGVDLGSAPTIDGLRTLWNNARARHGTLLESLRPIVVIREGARPGSVELRLVAGPLPSAALAQRMCVVITTTGTVCQPAVYDGQRLAMR